MNEDQFKKIDRNHVLIMILLMFIVVILLVHPVQAQYLTFTNSGSMTERDVNIYYPNVTTGQMSLLGRFNTTSIVETNGSIDYTFDLVPQQANPLDSPSDWLNATFAYVSTNVTSLIIIIFLAVIWLGRK